jgi:hypothetical protein
MIETINLCKSFLSLDVDNDLIKIEDLKWFPWIGNKYFDMETKVILLGESHYDWKKSDSLPKLKDKIFTRFVVAHQGLCHISSCKDYWRIFRNIERTFYNEKYVENKKREKIWSSVVYLNLVQNVMDSIKHRPQKEDYGKGWKVLKQTINLLKPKLVIVLGCENNKIIAFQEAFKDALTKNDEILNKVGTSFCRKSERDDVTFLFIRHPSSYYPWSKWHQEIKSFLPINLIE